MNGCARAPLAAALLLPGLALAAGDCPAPLGWMERVRIETETRWLEVDAKLDTGADSSSLHAQGLEVFEREDQNWVRFRLGEQTLEQPVSRVARIRQKNGEAAEERWVVTLQLCVGNTALPADFSLADRSGFKTPVLLGRDVLEQLGPVSPSRRHTVAPTCPLVPELSEPPAPETMESPQMDEAPVPIP